MRSTVSAVTQDVRNYVSGAIGSSQCKTPGVGLGPQARNLSLGMARAPKVGHDPIFPEVVFDICKRNFRSTEPHSVDHERTELTESRMMNDATVRIRRTIQ